MTRRAVLGAVLVVGLVPLTRSSLAQPADAANPFKGRYRYAGSNKERAAIDRAIEDVVSNMSFLVRSIARKRLKDANRVLPRIAVASDGHDLTVELGARAYTAPLDGRPIQTTGTDGGKVTLRYVVRGRTIEQWFMRKEGGRVNELFLDEGRLIMRVRVYSPKLPSDVRYRLTYVRE